MPELEAEVEKDLAEMSQEERNVETMVSLDSKRKKPKLDLSKFKSSTQ
jgi:hypothetical protein